ncbi:MAG: maleylacetoacetate isomerase [Novosphingobium sp.]|nr:maleylacetoacetate isomerase [Novosphingobium sp.]
MSGLVLHGYWRSTASWRIRIALALKGIAHEQITHDLRTGEQGDEDYLALNPQGLVPALVAPGGTFPQSLAILEWLEESWPVPRLLPEDRTGRARVRAMADLICCDIHPLNNLRVLRALRADFGADDAAIEAWVGGWIGAGFAVLERQIAQFGGRFAFGDAPTFADCCLVPQVYAAERFAVDLDPFPAIRRVAADCSDMPSFRSAHPAHQPDTD